MVAPIGDFPNTVFTTTNILSPSTFEGKPSTATNMKMIIYHLRRKYLDCPSKFQLSVGADGKDMPRHPASS